MSHYSKLDNYITNKVKVVLLDLRNYATKKELEHATGDDTSDLATYKDFVDKLDINKLVNI